MSLATRCTECGTVFRVVQDQLKVSEGWVRCGRCAAVFNALENLCELEGGHDAGATAPRHPAAAEATQPEPAYEAAASAVAEPTASEHDVVSTMPFVDDTPAAIVTFSTESLPDDASATAAGQAALPAEAPSAPPAPRFVQAAERAAFWRRPAMRAGLATLALLLGLLLTWQLAVARRDWLAAQWPALQPLLAVACRPLGCHIEPLRRIERLSVDSSGLARLEGAAMYRLSVVLHNRADTALAAPSIDLSLTDGSGKLVSRRVLQAAELGLPPVIDAGQELPLQALLSTGEHRISGYTVELFYP